MAYDWLILATGARHAYFGHDEWEKFAPGLKKIEDATAIRRRILVTFEEAENVAARSEQRGELNFVVIGGGPTGVEMAGAIVELARTALAKDFRHIDPRQTRVILLEAGPRLLTAFPTSLSAVAMKSLAKLGRRSHGSGAAVTECDAQGVTIGGESIASDCVIWAAGVAASPAAKWLGAEADRAGRVKVNPDLTVPGHPEIFVIGDTALVMGKDGKPVPGVAPGRQATGCLCRPRDPRRSGRSPAAKPFRYFNVGNLATIGRSSAIADFGWIRVSGFARLGALVRCPHLFPHRLSQPGEYSDRVDSGPIITFQRGARLITGPMP